MLSLPQRAVWIAIRIVVRILGIPRWIYIHLLLLQSLSFPLSLQHPVEHMGRDFAGGGLAGVGFGRRFLLPLVLVFFAPVRVQSPRVAPLIQQPVACRGSSARPCICLDFVRIQLALPDDPAVSNDCSPFLFHKPALHTRWFSGFVKHASNRTA